MTNIHRTLLFVTSVIMLSLLVFPTFAQVIPIIAPNCGFPGMNCTGAETFGGSIQPFVILVINTVLSLIGIIAAIYIIYAGIKYISSKGDEEASVTAKRQITFALLGVFIAGASQLIVNVVLIQDATLLIISIRSVVNAVLTLVGVVAAIYIIVGGVMYLSSQGDPDKASRAKMQVLYAILGIIVVALSALLVNYIINNL